MAEKAKGWLWYALAGAGALVAFLYVRSEPAPPADPAPVYDPVAERREIWTQFCAGFPCEELPMGFATVDAFGKRFYVPLPATIEAKTGNLSPTGKIPAVRGPFADISPTVVGSVEGRDYLRTYEGPQSNLYIRHCCADLLTYYGLVGPGYTDGMSSAYLNWPGIRLVNPNEVYTFDRNYLSSFVHGNSKTPDQNMTPDSLPEGYLTPFSTDFNYLNIDRDEGFFIISKQPMVDDRYILGNCMQLGRCEYHALRNPTDPVLNPKDPEGDFPLYATGLMLYDGGIPLECNLAMQEGAVNCPEVDVEFSKMAQFIRITARMLELMQEPPVQLQGTP